MRYSCAWLATTNIFSARSTAKRDLHTGGSSRPKHAWLKQLPTCRITVKHAHLLALQVARHCDQLRSGPHDVAWSAIKRTAALASTGSLPFSSVAHTRARKVVGITVAYPLTFSLRAWRAMVVVALTPSYCQFMRSKAICRLIIRGWLLGACKVGCVSFFRVKLFSGCDNLFSHCLKRWRQQHIECAV